MIAVHSVQTAKSASRVRPPDSPAQQQISPVRSAARGIQRQAGCACGGNCPRCRGAAHGQPGRAIGEHADSDEHEAHAVAAQVMRAFDPQIRWSPARPVVQRRFAECAEDETLRTGRDASAAGVPAAGAPPIVHDVLRSPGQPLDAATRAFMEPRFGREFGSVRLHTDSSAAQSARAIDALAYTVGNDVVFGEGQFASGTDRGRRLLAHELTHVVQQSHSAPSLQPALSIGAVDDPAEMEADRVADLVVSGPAPAPMPVIGHHAASVRRQPVPQARGARPQRAVLDQPPRGDDTVKIHIFRYLCNCAGRNVSRSSVSTRTRPRLGIVYQYCEGRTTVTLTGDVKPSSFTTGSVRATLDVDIAAERGGTGAHVQVQGEARNTGAEPQVGGTVSGRIAPGGGPQVGASGSVFVGTQTGQVETNVGVGVDVGGFRITGDVTNPQDPGRRFGISVGGDIPGQDVGRQFCRECDCPVVYECIEDIPPRPVPDEPITVTDTSRLRYYFRLDRAEDARTPALRTESTRMLDQLAALVAAGWTISRISGYASPEAAEREHNEPLSLSRGERLRERIAQRLPDVTLPTAEAGGELLGRIPTIQPGSSLADALFDADFSGPEQVSLFLFGDEIENDQLADQFLRLLNRVTEPADRLRLFGLTADSPIKNDLLAAIDLFIARRGRGARPWDPIFEYLRFAAVEVTHQRQVPSTGVHYTSGSVSAVEGTPCERYAKEAEDAALFGLAEKEPTRENCPTGHSPNIAEYESKCDYTR